MRRRCWFRYDMADKALSHCQVRCLHFEQYDGLPDPSPFDIVPSACSFGVVAKPRELFSLSTFISTKGKKQTFLKKNILRTTRCGGPSSSASCITSICSLSIVEYPLAAYYPNQPNTPWAVLPDIFDKFLTELTLSGSPRVSETSGRTCRT